MDIQRNGLAPESYMPIKYDCFSIEDFRFKKQMLFGKDLYVGFEKLFLSVLRRKDMITLKRKGRIKS